MTPTALLYHAAHGMLPPPGDAICWLCGAACPADGRPHSQLNQEAR